MNYTKTIGLWALLTTLTVMSCNPIMQTKKNADGTYDFETVPGDPMNVKILTLANGLKVYMSVQKRAPRIQTLIATRAGSKNDPSDATGLAHYLEHMLFKGSSKIASLDWEKEKVLLQQISDLYEKHRAARAEDRPAIYREIDSLSGLAAQYVAANEYDKITTSLGAKRTNAFTSLDQTVYMNDIPSNEVEKWMQLESERFSELVLRLFHTELETVYEEYNMGQASDGRKLFQAFMKGLAPDHPYGTQTTIGTGEHLKTPSMEKIHEFFSTYYVPNNMAIILAGDFDPNEMAALVDKYWGKFKAKPIRKKAPKAASPLTQKTQLEVVGKEKAKVQLGWRLPGVGTDEALKATLLAGILYNQKAGLIDINLIQKQAIGPQSSAGAWSANDYSFFYMYGEPRVQQSLEAVEDLLMKELDRLKMGAFEDWMLDAVINNLEITEINEQEANQGRAFAMLEAFIGDVSWNDWNKRYERMRSFTKEDIINFAKDYIRKENVVVVYKREGVDDKIEMVDKPNITPIELNTTTKSAYRQQLDQIQSPRQQPVFLDYKASINQRELKGKVPFEYIKNENNQTFELVYLVEMGRFSDNVLPIALRYLKFLGTNKYSPEAFQQELFKLGLSLSFETKDEVSYLILRGLERSFEQGVDLLEHLLADLKADEEVLAKMLRDLKKSRLDAKKDKHQILRSGMLSYAYYGDFSPFKARLSVRQFDVITTKDMLKRLNKLMEYEHRIFYYGTLPEAKVANILIEKHPIPESFKPLIPSRTFTQLPTDENKVVFVDYKGMPQVEIMLVSKGTPEFSLEESDVARLYNEYFGMGLSSIVFQEIREARALAYSAYVFNKPPTRVKDAHYLLGFVGTQSDKLNDALPAMRQIIEEMPLNEERIANAVDAILKRLETERITGSNIYWSQRSIQKLGLEEDPRKTTYEYYQKLASNPKAALETLSNYHKKYIKGRKFTFLVLGDKSLLNMDVLKQAGDLKELSLEQLFGY